jgi:ankyrin repeat protein
MFLPKEEVEEYVSEAVRDMQSITPSRSRTASTVIQLGSPTRTNVITQQEPTPGAASVMENEYLSPSLPAKRLFDEENTQRDFFESVYSRKRTRTGESNQLDEIIPEKSTFNSLKISVTEKRHAILMHLFVEEDSDYSTLMFLDMVKKPDDSKSIDLNFVLDNENCSLLHWAASCGRIKIVKLLIDHGDKINKTADHGVTPLMKALESVRNFSLQSMDALLSMLGPSIFTADVQGKTALHYANILSRYRSKREVSTYYMESMASYINDTRLATNSPFIAFIDAVDDNSDTALHLACRYKNHKNVALLVSLGASKDIENSAKESPLTLSKYDFRLQQLMVFIFSCSQGKVHFNCQKMIITMMNRQHH